MAQIVLTDVAVTVNSIALADRATQVVINYEKDAVEVTTFGATFRKFQGGLGSVTADVSFNQDYAAANVEATIYPLVGTTTTVVFKPTSGAVSATNPSYTLADTLVVKHTPINGAVGELGTTEVSFQGGTLTKATA